MGPRLRGDDTENAIAPRNDSVEMPQAPITGTPITNGWNTNASAA